MDNLFCTYLKLYPGKADVIMDAIRSGIESADNQCIKGRDREDEINSHILDALD
jgi:hypothetical protein